MSSNIITSNTPHTTTHNQSSSTNTNPGTFHAYRPRLLYSALFTWNTVTCGKFIAPFLQELSPSDFTDGVVGMTLALQYAIVAVLAGVAGRWSDAVEERCQRRHNELVLSRDGRERTKIHQGNCWGVGRLKVLSLSILLGTLAILGHAVPSLYTQYYATAATTYNTIDTNDQPQQHQIQQFPHELAWHITMRCIYAISLAIMAPTLDGLALAHLDCIDGASPADFGKERMYGAAFWGLGSLCTGVGIDWYGMEFLYWMTFGSAVVSFVVMGVYLLGLRWDTSGAFDGDGGRSASILLEEEEWGDIRYQGGNGSSFSRTASDQTGRGSSDATSAVELFSLICQTGYGKAMIFFVFTLAIGISIVDNLAFIFFDSLGSSNTMNGLTVVLTVLFEVPVFYLAPSFLEKHGPGKLLLAAGFAYVVRVVGYTMAPHMSVILILETLHGISYAGGKAGSVEYINQIAPKGYEATGQGLLIFVNYSGVVCGLFAGGHIQESFGARDMFFVMAAIVSLGTFVLLITEICFSSPMSGISDGDDTSNNIGESTNLTKSDSACSYADRATESFMRKNLKYDSLNKYVKDW